MKNFIKTLVAASLVLASANIQSMQREENIPQKRVEQADGKIIEAGTTNGLIIIKRFNRDGTSDATFGSSGIAFYAIGRNSSADSVSIQPDGKILVEGMSDGKPLKARLTTEGILDTTFGGGYGYEIAE